MINNTYRFLIDIHNLKTGKCHSVNFTVVSFFEGIMLSSHYIKNIIYDIILYT